MHAVLGFENTIFRGARYLDVGLLTAHGQLGLLVDGDRVLGVDARVALR